MFLKSLVLSLVLNMGLKVVTFSLTTYQTRLVTPAQGGVLFTYCVYVDTVLFLSREAVRGVCSRLPLSDKKKKEDEEDTEEHFSPVAVKNMVHLSSLCLFIAVCTMLLLELTSGVLGIQKLPSLYRTAREAYEGEDTVPPEVLVALSIVVLAVAEPCVVLVLSQPQLYKTIVLSEFFSLFARLVTTIVLVLALGGLPDRYTTRWVFSLAQLVYGVVHLLFFLLLFSKRAAPLTRYTGGSATLTEIASTVTREQHGVFPLGCYSIRGTVRMVRGQWQLLRRFLEESLLRLVFTEGENFALTAIGDVAARGTFQVISQLGSMVVRLVLSVWEGACFSRWSRLLAGGEHEAAVLLLRRMLKVMLFFGFSFILLGPPLSGWLLGVLYSSRWSSPETVRTLQLYCYATPAMGFSGLLECFLRAAASPEILRRQQKVLLVLSTAYVCGCFAIVTYRQEDAVSCLVLLNICSKVLRGWTSAYLITQCTKPGEGHSPLATWRDLTNVVGWRTVSVMLCLLRLSRVVPPRVSHMTGVGLLYLLLILTTEEVRQLIQEGVAKLRSRRVVQKSKE